MMNRGIGSWWLTLARPLEHLDNHGHLYYNSNVLLCLKDHRIPSIGIPRYRDGLLMSLSIYSWTKTCSLTALQIQILLCLKGHRIPRYKRKEWLIHVIIEDQNLFSDCIKISMSYVWKNTEFQVWDASVVIPIQILHKFWCCPITNRIFQHRENIVVAKFYLVVHCINFKKSSTKGSGPSTSNLSQIFRSSFFLFSLRFIFFLVYGESFEDWSCTW